MADGTVILNDLAGNRSLPIKAIDLGDGTYALATTATIDAGDIELGAVELKNAADDTRAKVLAASTLPALTDTALIVSQRDPLPAGTNLLGKVGIDQTTDGTTNKVVASGTGYTSQVTVTRPANTTPYTAGDVVGATAAAITFASIGPAAGGLILTDFDFRMNMAAIWTTMGAFRLQLYNVTPPSALADNDPWDLPAGDRAAYLGYIDLGTPVDVGSTIFVQSATDFRKKLLMGATTSLFAYLMTIPACTPLENSTVLSLRLNGVGV